MAPKHSGARARQEYTDRLFLIEAVYEHVLHETDSFHHGAVGGDLAYLLGAIAKGTKCEFSPSTRLVRVLRKLPKDHHVWRSISVRP